MRTPWGESQDIIKLAEGVAWVDTPGHGGVRVTRAVAEDKLSPAAVDVGEWFGGYFWFEEDCAWSAPAFEHPEWFEREFNKPAALVKQQAEDTLGRWYPAYRPVEA